jgi:hypothetical protein
VYDDEYFEYLLGDMFIMRNIGRLEVGFDTNQYVIEAYNTIHVGYKVKMDGR